MPQFDPAAVSGTRADASGRPVERVAFLLVPHFSLMAFASALEPLRAANAVAERPLYTWTLVSADGGPVTASNGIPVVCDRAIAPDDKFDMVALCTGLQPQTFKDDKVFGWIRRAAQMGAKLIGLSGGAYLMARAGLMEGYRSTIHWEFLAGYLEAFPDLEVTSNLFEVDRGRLTCAGGTAAIDLMLHLVAVTHGHDLATAVSEQFIHTRVRGSDDPQRMDLRQRTGVAHPKLLEAIDIIEKNLSEPLSQAELARNVGLSTRQLERLFKLYLKVTPSRYYLETRLKHAQKLLIQTSLSVLEVALACGFASASHFAKCYRGMFGHPPRAERLPAA